MPNVNTKVEYLEKKLLMPYSHILQVQGKMLRKKIPMALNHWLKLPQDKLQEIVNTVNMLHNGSLLIDDIQDNSLLRRTIPAAHCIYGVPLTINTSFYVMSKVLEKIIQFDHPMAVKVFSEQLTQVARGQGIDIYWRDNFICPTEEEYKNMVIEKTGGMFLLGTRLMQLFSDNKNDHTKFTKLIGLYFQIRDDYCNLNHQEALEDWPGTSELSVLREYTFCEDITEGKYTLPVIHALQKPEGEELLNILKLRTRDVAIKRYFVSQLDKLGSLQYTRDVLQQLDQEIQLEVGNLGGNPEMMNILNELRSWQKEDDERIKKLKAC